MTQKQLRLGNIQVRDVDGTPSRFEGMALPFGVTIEVAYGKERFSRGAFADAVASMNGGERLAFLNKHGTEGGVPVGIIDTLQERTEGLFFGGSWMSKPEADASRTEIVGGLDGVSVEFVPGKHRRKGDATEHYAGVRLAAIAGSYAPAYRSAKVALRSITGRKNTMPLLSASALTERRAALATQVATIRQIAESESRNLDDTETGEVETLSARMTNIDALIVDANADAQRRDAERNALPRQTVGQAVITRAENVYGPATGQSFFGDLYAVSQGNSEAQSRMARHRAMVLDIASRATDTGDISGAFPSVYAPDLYVPDIAYSGPLSSFFASTPISDSRPIIVPAFDSALSTGDTGRQTQENTPVPNVDTATKPLTITPVTIGGETIVSRQVVDGASPGADVIIAARLKELLMRDREREIALVLEALTSSGVWADTAGTTPKQSGADIERAIRISTASFLSTRFLPVEGVLLNKADYENLAAAEDTTGRPLIPFLGPNNASGTFSAGYSGATVAGVPIESAWAIINPTFDFIARRNDARQWQSTVLDIKLDQRNGPQSIVFAVWQYFAFAVLEPAGVKKFTYTNV